MVPTSNPLPTKSSIYNQKNCIMSTNRAIRKVAIKGPMNDLMINISNFFITYYLFNTLMNAPNVKLSINEIEL